MTAKVSPTFQKQLDRLIEETLAALATPDVQRQVNELRVLIAAAGGLESSEETPKVRAAVEARTVAILETVRRENGQVVDYLADWGIKDLILSQLAGRILQPLGFRQLPGYQDPNPFFVRDEPDAEWMKEKLHPGQIWVDATNLTQNQFRDLWGAISYQKQAGLGRDHMPAGRPAGSVKGRRAALLAEIRDNPDWSDRQIVEAGIKCGAWDDLGPFQQHPETYKARVRRAKRTAEKSVA